MDFLTTSMEAKFTAGPAINITNAAPGESPFIINAAAMGMLPVEQIYIGTAIISITNICNRGCEPKLRKNSSGTATLINAANNRPTNNRNPIL